MRFSIVVTCYNQADFIQAAVDSALTQPNRGIEILVVDDGSSDGSLEILERYGDSIRLVKLPENRGAIEARNQGAARATGEYLLFLDGDDVLTPWALDVYERIVTERRPKIILGPNVWFRGTVPPVKDSDVPQKIQFVDYRTFVAKDRPVGFNASTFVIERRAFHDAGGWSPGIFHLDCQELCTKLGVSGRMILIDSPPTAFYRIHATNSIHTVEPFLKMAHHLIDKERAGEYPGGSEHRFERRAWLGGLWFFWTKRAFRAGLYKDGIRLVASGWSMILAAIVRRTFAWITKPRPMETLAFRWNSAPHPEPRG